MLMRTVPVFFLFVYYLTDDILADTNNVGIVGGHRISIKDAPYMTSIRLNGTLHWCGGSIIHEQFVLTAAHCIIPNAYYKVLVGTDKKNKGGKLYNVDKIIEHKLFNNKTMDYDICLLKLERKLTFGPKVNKTALFEGSPKLEENMVFRATGWGWTNALYPKNLRQVEVPFVPANICEQIYQHRSHVQITARMMCAGISGKDTCVGDSGGPLTYQSVQVGITSFGLKCGAFAGVYTRINELLPWIKQTIHQNL